MIHSLNLFLLNLQYQQAQSADDPLRTFSAAAPAPVAAIIGEDLNGSLLGLFQEALVLDVSLSFATFLCLIFL